MNSISMITYLYFICFYSKLSLCTPYNLTPTIFLAALGVGVGFLPIGRSPPRRRGENLKFSFPNFKFNQVNLLQAFTMLRQM